MKAKKKKPSKKELIRAHLEAGLPLTPLDAWRQYRCYRLGARIYDLRRDGLDIVTDHLVTPEGECVASYRLRESHTPPPAPAPALAKTKPKPKAVARLEASVRTLFPIGSARFSTVG